MVNRGNRFTCNYNAHHKIQKEKDMKGTITHKIISLIIQLNAHIQLNIRIVYQMSSTCFGAHCAILKENSLSLLETSAIVRLS